MSSVGELGLRIEKILQAASSLNNISTLSLDSSCSYALRVCLEDNSVRDL